MPGGRLRRAFSYFSAAACGVGAGAALNPELMLRAPSHAEQLPSIADPLEGQVEQHRRRSQPERAAQAERPLAVDRRRLAIGRRQQQRVGQVDIGRSDAREDLGQSAGIVGYLERRRGFGVDLGTFDSVSAMPVVSEK